MSLTFAEWISYGVDKGWVSEPACATHDGVPSTEDELTDLDEGYDPCQHVLRLWPVDED